MYLHIIKSEHIITCKRPQCCHCCTYRNLTYKTLTMKKMLNNCVLFSTATKDKQAQDTNTHTTFFGLSVSSECTPRNCTSVQPTRYHIYYRHLLTHLWSTFCDFFGVNGVSYFSDNVVFLL
jgi:hypothetical protein